MNLNGVKKSAILLMSIGVDQASEILKHLTPFEVQELVISMLDCNQVPDSILNIVLSECHHLFIKNNSVISNNSTDYINDVLTKCLGNQKGNELLNKVLEFQKIKNCIKTLNSMPSEKVAHLLDQQHPQVITSIVVNLEKKHAAKIISHFNEEKCSEIILRMVDFNGIKESNLSDLNNIIDNFLQEKNNLFSDKGGIKCVAKILHSMKIEYEKNILKKISLHNKNISCQIIKEMFLFKNIIHLDDTVISCLIENLDQEKLYIALQGTDLMIREKFFKNMNQERAKELSIHLEKKSYISKKAVQNEQKLVLMMAKNIIDNGVFALESLGKYYV